ncbi:nucleotide exchange factor GrpE [Lentibacillus sp. L22]|uniref:nucleotide exchange factor GrpE n=1 Tax=Lentibacillus TaxID=175304 RepID=UPI0022B0D480|nr:nucleotide exchange factor GrpE [Lentibacillus daqui]
MVTEQNKETADTNEFTETEPETEILDEETNDEEQTLDSDESVMESLKEEIASLKQEKEDMYQRVLRSQAEFENFKKRTQKEREKDRKYKAQDLVSELLPALDNFERALNEEVTEANKSFVEGIEMVYNQLKDALKSQGVEEIEAVGKPFDPNVHHAVMQIEDPELEAGSVVEELQKGYMLKDRVIRPAMVKVNQ